MLPPREEQRIQGGPRAPEKCSEMVSGSGQTTYMEGELGSTERGRASQGTVAFSLSEWGLQS